MRVICCLSVTRSRMILITVSHEMPVGRLLSRDCPWLASAFRRAFGEFSWDDVFCSSVAGMSHLGLWVGGSIPLVWWREPPFFQKCAEIIVAHLGYLNYTQYTVTVGFEHLNQPIREMNFTVSTQPATRSCSCLVRCSGTSEPRMAYFGKPVF